MRFNWPDIYADVTIPIVIELFIDVDPESAAVDERDPGKIRWMLAFRITRRKARGPIGTIFPPFDVCRLLCY